VDPPDAHVALATTPQPSRSGREGIRQSVTKRRLFGAKRKTLLGVVAYPHRNRARTRYDEYLAPNGALPVLWSRAHARTSSKIGWSVRDALD
jgi:hypothetical protein